MKKYLIHFTLLIVLLVGCGKNKEDSATTLIKTPSMVCNNCAKTIQTAVAKLDGVEEVKADVGSKTVSVKFMPAKVNLEALEKAITGAGYDANDKKRNTDAYEKLDKCCKIDG